MGLGAWRLSTSSSNQECQRQLRCVRISFTTFCHRGGNEDLPSTKNILLVKKLLGHKRIESTMKYTQLIHFKEDEYNVAATTTIEQDQELLKTGCEHHRTQGHQDLQKAKDLCEV